MAKSTLRGFSPEDGERQVDGGSAPTTAFGKVNRYVKERNRQYSVSEPFAKAHGYTLSELLVLIALHYDRDGYPSDGCTQKNIVERENLTKQTVSSIIQSFLKRDFVTVETDPEDRRAKIVRLTDEGRAVTKPVVDGYVRRWNGAVSELSDDEYEKLMRAMADLADRIECAFSE